MKPLLFSIVSEQTLQSMIDTFYACMNLPIKIIDEYGNAIAYAGESASFCERLKPFLPSQDNCEQVRITASKRAISYGETYIFSCHASLNNIVFPLLSKTTFLGSVLVGPFLMDDADSILISDVAKKYHIPIDDALELYDEARSISRITPAMTTHISRLLYYLFSGLIADSKDELKKNSQKLFQQSKINESIQRYKLENMQSPSYPYEKEKELVSIIRTGKIQEAKAVLNDLLGYVLFSEGSSLDIVKNRAIELCSILSRAAIESGTSADSIFKLNNAFLKNIQELTSFDALCYALQEIAESFSESIFDTFSTQSSGMIKKAKLFISEHFAEPLSLEDVAAHVDLSPSYFSTVFKEHTQTSFKEYLNYIRIEESKRLLSNTDYSIIDIAIAVGFEDQSYFSKVFKKYTGMTPKQYR